MRRYNTDLSAEVAALDDLTRDALAERWHQAHGHPPPKGIRHELLVRSASWHLQARRSGGLSATVLRMLKRAIVDVEYELAAKRPGKLTRLVKIGEHGVPSDGANRDAVGFHGEKSHRQHSEALSREDTSTLAPPVARSLLAKRMRQTVSPGARLVRDWNGKTHVVDIIEEGFVFQAKVHKSLTAIARQITGAHWSGPRFFGL